MAAAAQLLDLGVSIRRAQRLRVPDALAGWVSDAHAERVLHTYGGHPLELLEALLGRFPNPARGAIRSSASTRG